MKILGIETSCDETSVALVEDGRMVLSNLIASQVRIHARFGGVVPEVASRAHLQQLLPMVDECLSRHAMTLADVDALAVTRGPGLVGALLVGVETAKALAWAARKPLIPVHHIAAHLYAPFLIADASASRMVMMDLPEAEKPADTGKAAAKLPIPPINHPPSAPLIYPYLGLVVSGGHTSLIHVHSPLQYTILAETVDDAAGEAFDKTAKLLELGYPGGPLVAATARGGDRHRFKLPRPMLAGSGIQFSFSGLKTAVGKIIRDLGLETFRNDEQMLRDLCASFEEAVVETLLRKARRALRQTGLRQLAIVGGVASNQRLREATAEYLPSYQAVFPPAVFCTDNAAMIAGLAHHYRETITPTADLTMNARADLPIT